MLYSLYIPNFHKLYQVRYIVESGEKIKIIQKVLSTTSSLPIRVNMNFKCLHFKTNLDNNLPQSSFP